MARTSNKVIALRAVLARNLKAVPQLAPKKGLAKDSNWKPVTVALLIRLEARPGREKELGNFLRASLARVQQEPTTVAWFANRSSKSTFAIYCVFTEEKGRQAHLTAALATMLKEPTRGLLAKPPVIEKIEVLAAKLVEFQLTD